MISMERILEEHLRRRDSGGDSQWSIWERKNWNMHRGVLLFRPSQPGTPFSDVNDAVREEVAQSFRISWWRGFAFGAVIEFPSLPSDVSAVVDSIDGRNRSAGCWQWALLVCQPLKTAIGVHTWMEVALTPLYRALLAELRRQSYEVGNFKKEKDSLIRFLTSVSSLKGHSMPEFRP
jgi:hypothetical protein